MAAVAKGLLILVRQLAPTHTVAVWRQTRVVQLLAHDFIAEELSLHPVDARRFSQLSAAPVFFRRASAGVAAK